MQKDLNIFGMKCKNLNEYTTSKNDIKKKVSRMPNEQYRID